MTKKNPLRGWYSDMFGSRGVDVGQALEYVDQLAMASSDPVAVQTAARVLLNTVIAATDQIINAPSPERVALIELIDQRISEWIDLNLDVDDRINDWMSNNFDIDDYNLNDPINEKINEWMDDSLADKINDLDLVVRIR